MTKVASGSEGDRLQPDVVWIEKLKEIASMQPDDLFLRQLWEFIQTPISSVYTPDQLAALVNKTGDTVRGWCRDERIHAYKIEAKAGDKLQWRISHDELIRYRAEGLLPSRKMQKCNPKPTAGRFRSPNNWGTNGDHNLGLNR